MNMDDMSVSENGQFYGRFKGGHDDQASKLGILMDFGHLGFETGAWTPQFYLFRIGKIIINYGICCFPQMFRYILMCSLAQQNHFSPTQGEMVGVSSEITKPGLLEPRRAQDRWTTSEPFKVPKNMSMMWL